MEGALHPRAGSARRLALAAGVLAALGLPADAASPAPEAKKPPAPAKALSGAIVEHQESGGARILYLEATGGLAVPVAPPVAGSRREPLPPQPPARPGEAPRKPGGAAPAPAKP
ncbi:MAG: hypothetical protein AB7P08_01930 [Burkholderiales bacterium]